MDPKEYVKMSKYFMRKYGLAMGIFIFDLYWVLDKWGTLTARRGLAREAFEHALRTYQRRHKSSLKI